MTAPLSAIIRGQRQDLLGKIEAFATEYIADLERRGADLREYWCYLHFCSPMVLDLVAWERIHADDLKRMPSVKRLFVNAARSAHFSVSVDGQRDPELDRGKGRRTFSEISIAELAANILPRLEQILVCWGISYDQYSDKFSERELTDDEAKRLTRYYGEI